MSKLAYLVPPLNLCKLIPEGEFEDSLCIWVNGLNSKPKVILRPWDKKTIAAPAPTLEEILYNMPPICRFRPLEWRNEKNIAEKILKVWLKLRGIDYE